MTRVASADLQRFLDLAVEGDASAAVALAVEVLERPVPLDEVVVDLLAEAQRRAGEQWMRGDWTVADEHLVSGVTQKALDAVAARADVPATKGRVVLACAQGDWHALPSQMFAEQLRARGYAVAFLGASTPADHVAMLLERRPVDALVVSCQLPLFFDGVARLAAAAHLHGVPVLAGGRALSSGSTRAVRLGADGWAGHIDEAVEVLAGWQARPPQVSTWAPVLEPLAELLHREAAAIGQQAFELLAAQKFLTAMRDEPTASCAPEDMVLLVQALAAARLVDDSAVFGEIVAWMGPVLERRGMPADALADALSAVATAVDKVDAGSAELVRGYVES